MKKNALTFEQLKDELINLFTKKEEYFNGGDVRNGSITLTLLSISENTCINYTISNDGIYHDGGAKDCNKKITYILQALFALLPIYKKRIDILLSNIQARADALYHSKYSVFFDGVNIYDI